MTSMGGRRKSYLLLKKVSESRIDLSLKLQENFLFDIQNICLLVSEKKSSAVLPKRKRLKNWAFLQRFPILNRFSYLEVKLVNQCCLRCNSQVTDNYSHIAMLPVLAKLCSSCKHNVNEDITFYDGIF